MRSAEVTAEIATVEYVLQDGVDDRRPVFIRFDSEFTATIVDSKSRNDSHPVLADICAAMWRVAKNVRRIQWQHVKSHDEEPFNELVDRVVFAAAKPRKAFGRFFLMNQPPRAATRPDCGRADPPIAPFGRCSPRGGFFRDGRKRNARANNPRSRRRPFVSIAWSPRPRIANFASPGLPPSCLPGLPGIVSPPWRTSSRAA